MIAFGSSMSAVLYGFGLGGHYPPLPALTEPTPIVW